MKYELTCEKCKKVIGTTDVENHAGHMCQACLDAVRLEASLAEGTNYEAKDLLAEKPEIFEEIVSDAFKSNPDIFENILFSKSVMAIKEKLVEKNKKL